jgi:hypothetical protein
MTGLFVLAIALATVAVAVKPTKDHVVARIAAGRDASTITQDFAFRTDRCESRLPLNNRDESVGIGTVIRHTPAVYQPFTGPAI